MISLQTASAPLLISLKFQLCCKKSIELKIDERSKPKIEKMKIRQWYSLIIVKSSSKKDDFLIFLMSFKFAIFKLVKITVDLFSYSYWSGILGSSHISSIWLGSSPPILFVCVAGPADSVAIPYTIVLSGPV